MGRRSLVLVLAALAAPLAHAYVWKINEKYTEEKLSFSELYMYADKEGPAPFGAGTSDITVALGVEMQSTLTATQQTRCGDINVSLLIFETESTISLDDIDLCNLYGDNKFKRFTRTKNFGSVEAHNLLFSQHPASCGTLDDEENDPSVTSVFVRENAKVKEKGMQYVMLEVCSPIYTPSRLVTHLHGTITFHNPYGYLPAIFFGFLPFEGVRAGLMFLFNVGFIILLMQHRDKLLPLHFAILAVSIIATAEASTWFGAYMFLNTTGTPLCCPFPAPVVAAMVLEMLRRTFSRVLLLLVSLGYGLVRPSLELKEYIMIALLSLAYLVASVVADATKISQSHDLTNSGSSDNVALDVPVLLFDLIFLVWIYLALVNVMATLKACGQAHKLEMYTGLAYVIGTFVALVSLLTVIIFISRLGAFEWPWELRWAQTVPLEILNFAVIAAVCVIWRPTERSKLLAMHQQIPTGDADDDIDEEVRDDDLEKFGQSGDDLDDLNLDDGPARGGGGGYGKIGGDLDDDDDGIEMR